MGKYFGPGSPIRGGSNQPMNYEDWAAGQGRRGNILYNGQYINEDEANDLRKKKMDQQLDEEFLNRQRNKIREDRSDSMREGEDFARKYFTDDLLKSGLVDENASPEMQDILARRKSALSGLTAEENQALREDTFKDLQRDQDTASRAARASLASTGVRGGAALAAQVELAKNNAAQAVDLNRKLMLDNVNIRNNALNAYEQTYGTQRQDLLGRQTYNINRRDTFAEKKAALPLLYAGLGAGERGEALSQLLGEKGIDAAKKYSGGGKKHLCGELKRRGLMSQDEYDRMAKLSARSVFYYGNFSRWYFKNARKLIRNMNAMNADWTHIKYWLITPAMGMLEVGYDEMAAHHYGHVLRELVNRYGHGPETVQPFKESFFLGGYAKNWKGILYTLTHKDFWGLLYRMARVHFKKKVRARIYDLSFNGR